jgi:hypothetical protein
MVLKDGYTVLEGLALGLFIGLAGRAIVRAYLDIEVTVVAERERQYASVSPPAKVLVPPVVIVGLHRQRYRYGGQQLRRYFGYGDDSRRPDNLSGVCHREKRSQARARRSVLRQSLERQGRDIADSQGAGTIRNDDQ